MAIRGIYCSGDTTGLPTCLSFKRIKNTHNFHCILNNINFLINSGDHLLVIDVKGHMIFDIHNNTDTGQC